MLAAVQKKISKKENKATEVSVLKCFMSIVIVLEFTGLTGTLIGAREKFSSFQKFFQTKTLTHFREKF